MTVSSDSDGNDGCNTYRNNQITIDNFCENISSSSEEEPQN